MSFFNSSLDAALAETRANSVQQGTFISGQGGVGGSPSPSSPYASRDEVVIPVVWKDGMCGGFIRGTGNRIICAENLCSTAAHKRNALPSILPGDMFIPAQGGTRRCYTSPRMSLTDFPGLVQDYLQKPRSTKELTRIFGKFEKVDMGELLMLNAESIVEFIGQEGEVTDWIPATPGKIHETVHKPKFATRLSVEEESLGKDAKTVHYIAELEAVLRDLISPASPSEEDAGVFLASEWPKIQRTFSSIAVVVKSIYEVVANSKEHNENKLITVLEQLERNMTEVFALIGDFDKKDDTLRTFGVNLSSALAGVGLSVREIQDYIGLEEQEIEESPPKRRKIAQRIADLEDHLTGAMNENMSFLLREIQALQRLAKEGGPMDRSGEPMETDDDAREKARMEGLRDEVATIYQDLRELQEVVAKEEYKKELTKKNEGSLAPLKFGGHEFHTLKEAAYFLAPFGDFGKKPAYFYDIFSLGAFSELNDTSMMDRIINRGVAKKGGLGVDPNENAVLLSFGCDRPPIIGLTRDILRSKNEVIHVLPKVKSLKEWYSTSEYEETIMKKYRQAAEDVERYLEGLSFSADEYPKLLPLYNVASTMLSTTKSFMDELNSQIDAFYRRITQAHLGTTDEEAWALISEMLSAVFEEVYKARSTFGPGIIDEPNLVQRSAKALVGTYGAHMKMKEIKAAGFTKHPCVVPALSLHLFSRKASVSALKRLEERVLKVEQLAKTGEDAHQRISRSEFDKWKVDHFEKLKNEYAALKGLVERNYKELKVVKKA